jgi:hypothetical protein
VCEVKFQKLGKITDRKVYYGKAFSARHLRILPSITDNEHQY